MVEIRSGILADMEAAAAFLSANGIGSAAPRGNGPEAPSALFAIALHAGRVVGLARGGQAREARGTGADIPGRFHVNTVIVEPRFRGAGVGRGLVRRLLDDARAGGFSTAQLWVHTGNAPALFLYERLGFEPVGPETEDKCLGRIRQMAADLAPQG